MILLRARAARESLTELYSSCCFLTRKWCLHGQLPACSLTDWTTVGQFFPARELRSSEQQQQHLATIRVCVRTLLSHCSQWFPFSLEGLQVILYYYTVMLYHHSLYSLGTNFVSIRFPSAQCRIVLREKWIQWFVFYT